MDGQATAAASSPPLAQAHLHPLAVGSGLVPDEEALLRYAREVARNLAPPY